MNRYVVILLMLLTSCASIWAQESQRRAMVVRLTSGDSIRFALSDIAAIEFAAVGHEAVDLGLSVRWASCNVGAENPEDLGGLYAWGETDSKDNYAETNYRYYSGTDYQNIGVNISGTRYDVATTQWGDGWRMPTRSEARELMQRCQWTPETLGGVSGYRVTGPSGRSIFMPSAGQQQTTGRTEAGTCGYYWTGTLCTAMPSSAYNINFRGYDDEWTACRAYGFSVRPVCK